MRLLLILLSALSIAGCGLFRNGPFKKRIEPEPYPQVSFEEVQTLAGGLHPPDHVALAGWDERYYYFEWRKIVEPATVKTRDGNGRVPIREFDLKNGQALERKVGIVGKEDFNGQLYNAGVN